MTNKIQQTPGQRFDCSKHMLDPTQRRQMSSDILGILKIKKFHKLIYTKESVLPTSTNTSSAPVYCQPCRGVEGSFALVEVAD